ncbi:MAG: hypothetical protein AABY83_07670 [Pseudomonadota bacterium]
MSPLLNKIMTWLSPTPLNVGVAIDRQRVSVVCADATGVVVGQTTILMASPCFTGDVTAEIQVELDAAFQRVAAAYGARCPRVQIVLPDAAVTWRVFNLEHKPQKARDTTTLARWRIAKETGAQADTLCCAWQWLDAGDTTQRLLAIAFNRQWAEAIRQASWRAGLLPHTIAAGAVYVWNDLQTRFPALRNVAILRIDTQQWTVMLITKGVVEYVHGRWRRAETDVNEIASITAQSIKAFVCAETDNVIDELIVTGYENDARPVMEALKKSHQYAPRWIQPAPCATLNGDEQPSDLAACAAVEAR